MKLPITLKKKETAYKDYAMGARLDTRITLVTGTGIMEEGVPLRIDEGIANIYARIFDICRKKGIDVLMVKAPVSNSQWSYERHKAVDEFCTEQGVPFVDYCIPELYSILGLDSSHDYYNDTHLNVYGAQKLTSALGEYIKENYPNIADRRGEAAYSFIDTYAAEYDLEINPTPAYASVEEYMQKNEGLVLKEEIPEIHLEASETSKYKYERILEAPQVGATYVISIDSATISSGETDRVTIRTYDFTESKAITREDILIGGEEILSIFTIPQDADVTNAAILLYAGVAGNTENNSVTFKNIKIYEHSR